LIQKKEKNFHVNFFKFLVIKTLDPDRIRIGIQSKMLDPDPYQMNTDPKPCCKHTVLLLMQPGVDSQRTVRTGGFGGRGAPSFETGRHGGQAGQPKTVSSR
jgi:hypothetical protein